MNCRSHIAQNVAVIDSEPRPHIAVVTDAQAAELRAHMLNRPFNVLLPTESEATVNEGTAAPRTVQSPQPEPQFEASAPGTRGAPFSKARLVKNEAESPQPISSRASGSRIRRTSSAAAPVPATAPSLLTTAPNAIAAPHPVSQLNEPESQATRKCKRTSAKSQALQEMGDDEVMEVDVDSDEEVLDSNEPGPSTRSLRPRPKAKVHEVKPKRLSVPIRADPPNDETVSKIVNGHKLFINQVGEVIVNDDDIMSDDEDFEEAVANYAPKQYSSKTPDDIVERGEVPTKFTEFFEITRRIHEISDAAVLRFPGDPWRSWMECMEEEVEKLTDLWKTISKIRDFPFSETELNIVWDTTPQNESMRALWPTHLLLSNIFMTKTLIEQTCEDLKNGQFTTPEDPMKWVEEVREHCQRIRASDCVPADCQVDLGCISLVEIAERNEENETYYKKYADLFPKDPKELVELMQIYHQDGILRRMFSSPRKFQKVKILDDLLKMVHFKYMPRGGIYLKLLLNIAYHFQYDLKSRVWQMVVLEEERIFEGIDFNQQGEPINIKYPPNIHDRLAAKAEKEAKRAAEAKLFEEQKAARDAERKAKAAEKQAKAAQSGNSK